MSDFQNFLDEWRNLVEPLERESSVSWWEASINSGPETQKRAGDAQKALTRAYADKASFDRLKSFDPDKLPADQARQFRLLYNGFLSNQMEDSVIVEMIDLSQKVESEFNRYRPTLDGQPVGENAIRGILRSSLDLAARKDAWEAGKAIGPIVQGDVLKLVALRNREAVRLGYADYYDFSLTLQELEPQTLFEILDDVERQTDAPFGAYKASLDLALAHRFGISVEELRPWHYGDPFFQEAPAGTVNLDRFFTDKDIEALTARFFAEIGLPVVDILERSDLYERANKNQHAFCIHIGRYEDVRILCNCVPTAQWATTTLHELGHAVYDKYFGEDLPFFLREPAHILTTEAIAMLFGRLGRNAAWLSRYAGVPEEEAARVATSAVREQAEQLLIMARWCLVMAHFERGLYSDPTQDLNRLWWSLVNRFQGITPPEDREMASDWAAKIHIATAPVYYHNYLLGEMFASQLKNHLQTVILPEDSDDKLMVSSPKVGDYLRSEVFARGARLSWNELSTAATGEGLNALHFASDFNILATRNVLD